MRSNNILLGLTIASALLTSSCAPSRSPATVTVQNATSETIVDLTVDVSGERLSTRAIAPNQETTLTYTIGAESDYQVIATFASGRRVEDRVGYVDGGLTSHDQLIIHADHVDFAPFYPDTGGE